jgi:PAS domain S-box-containing protein
MPDLDAIGGNVEDALGRVRVPSYVIDRHGIIRWLNPAARGHVGDVRGRHFTSVVAPEDKRRAHEIFLRNLTGTPYGSDNHVVVVGEDGERIAIEVSAVPLVGDDRVIGVFGQVKRLEEEAPPPPPHPNLTPRQNEVLRLLQDGRSTQQIAGDLHVSVATARNHIRHLLRTLGVHSRLEAVAFANREHAVTH